jgi:hypothetical protein
MKNHHYKEFAKLCRNSLENTFQLNSKYFNSLKEIDFSTINENNWDKQVISILNEYRVYLRSKILSGQPVNQCAVVKIFDLYFDIVNKNMMDNGKIFDGNDIAGFTLKPSQSCNNVQTGGKNAMHNDEYFQNQLANQMDLMNPFGKTVEKVEEATDEWVETVKENQEIIKALSAEEKAKLEQKPGENIHYDIFRGFRPNDGFNASKLVDWIRQILEYELSLFELKTLEILNNKFKTKLDEILKEHNNNETRFESRKNEYIQKCDTYKLTIFNSDIAIFKRLQQLGEYKQYIKKTATDNKEYQDKLLGTYAAFNFRVNQLLDNNINKEIEELDLNNSRVLADGLRVLRETYKSAAPKKTPATEEKNLNYRFIEFYEQIFKKFIINDNEPCSLLSPFNFEKMADCIFNTTGNIYKNHPLGTLSLMNKQLKDKQDEASTAIFKFKFGYMYMDEMFNKYKDTHPFFYDEVKGSIKEYDDFRRKEEERQGKKTGVYLETLKGRKEKFEKELYNLKMEAIAEQELNKHKEEKKALEVFAKRQAALNAKEKHQKEMAEQAEKFDIQVYKSKGDNQRNMRMSRLRSQLTDITNKIEDFERSNSINEVSQALNMADDITMVGGQTKDENNKLKYLLSEFFDDDGREIKVDYMDDIDRSRDSVKIGHKDGKIGSDEVGLNLHINQRVYLQSKKYGNLNYIYLLNASCKDFNPTSRIWQQTGDNIDISLDMYQSNRIDITKPKKNLLTSNFGKKFDMGTDIESNLADCSEYRLRSFKQRDLNFYDNLMERRKLGEMQKFKNFSRNKDLLTDYDMWTIQKNISRPLAEEENDIEESEWIDLADIKMKYPDKLSALDNMILSDNEFRRKKALGTLIKYVSWPTIPENYNANKENPMDRNKIEYNVTPHDMKSPEPFYDDELNIRL